MYEYFQNFWMTGKYVSRMGGHIQNLCTKTVDMSDTRFGPRISLNFLFHMTLYISLES